MFKEKFSTLLIILIGACILFAAVMSNSRAEAGSFNPALEDPTVIAPAECRILFGLLPCSTPPYHENVRNGNPNISTGATERPADSGKDKPSTPTPDRPQAPPVVVTDDDDDHEEDDNNNHEEDNNDNHEEEEYCPPEEEEDEVEEEKERPSKPKKPKKNASEHNGKGGNDGKGGKSRDGSKNSDKGRKNR